MSADYAEGVAALREAAARNFAKIEDDLAGLRRLFEDGSDQLRHIEHHVKQCRIAAEHIEGEL